MEEFAKIFGVKTIKKHWSLIPTLAITAFAVGMCGSYISYMSITKPDLKWSPHTWRDDPPYMNISPTEVRKMRNYHAGKYEIDPAIVQLRKDIGSYKER